MKSTVPRLMSTGELMEKTFLRWQFIRRPLRCGKSKRGTDESLVECLLSASDAIPDVSYWERRYSMDGLIIYLGKHLSETVGLLFVYGENVRNV